MRRVSTTPVLGRFRRVKELFLANSAVVLTAVSDPVVADAWDDDSVLDGQTIGSLVAHLARGSVWVVGHYLNAAPPDGPVDFETAAEYYAIVASALTSEDHASIRDRGATIAADGHPSVVAQLTDHVGELTELLPNENAERLVAVFAGKVMRLDDYLVTRLVEQVVHLDDLAESLGIEPWQTAPGVAPLVISCGAEIGRLRSGGPAMIRALFRNHTGALPVI